MKHIIEIKTEKDISSYHDTEDLVVGYSGLMEFSRHCPEGKPYIPSSELVRVLKDELNGKGDENAISLTWEDINWILTKGSSIFEFAKGTLQECCEEVLRRLIEEKK